MKQKKAHQDIFPDVPLGGILAALFVDVVRFLEKLKSGIERECGEVFGIHQIADICDIFPHKADEAGGTYCF